MRRGHNPKPESDRGCRVLRDVGPPPAAPHIRYLRTFQNSLTSAALTSDPRAFCQNQQKVKDKRFHQTDGGGVDGWRRSLFNQGSQLTLESRK